MKQSDKKHKSMGDRFTYAYIRRIKKWMFCPACQQGKMTIDNKSSIWICADCGYRLSADEFEDDYVFWFCDKCNSYLNNQEGFDRQAVKHICRNCGYENDTTFDNIKGICSDCGGIIPNPNGTLCIDCKQLRKQKAKERFIVAGKVVGTVAAVAGAVYLASQATDDDESTGYTPISGGDSDEEEDAAGVNYSDKWFKSATDSELDVEREKVRVVYANAGRTGMSDEDVDDLYWLLN